jgi:hypothetical protein
MDTPALMCELVEGSCSHVFHSHCVRRVAIANRDVAVKDAQLRHKDALARLSGFADAPDSRVAYEELVQHGLATER